MVRSAMATLAKSASASNKWACDYFGLSATAALRPSTWQVRRRLCTLNACSRSCAGDRAAT